MSNISSINRLQLRHHGIGSGYTKVDGVFDSREEAIEYISGSTQMRYATSGLSNSDRNHVFSLFAEPTVLRYKNEENERDPHVIVAIGSMTNENDFFPDNHFCIIDIDKTESEISELWDELENAIKSLSIITKNSNTLTLHSEKTDDGTIISGDVRVASSHAFDKTIVDNIILDTEDGLFTYVDLSYDESSEKITFIVNGDKKEIQLTNNYVVRGWYDKKDESLHLKMKQGDDIVISFESLIDEWSVEGENSNTPIVLTRDKVGYGNDSVHNHTEPWQDVLKADVRIASGLSSNILEKTNDGRYLFVNGQATNIKYFKDGKEITVADALNDCAKKKLSTDSNNILYEKVDGYFATASLKYNNKKNQLTFKSSNVTGGTTEEVIQLNSVDAFNTIYYDSTTEELVIIYFDGNGDQQQVRINIGEMLRDWEWDIENEAHNVKLHKDRVINGNDKVSADVAILEGNNNILEDVNHMLYVKGTADNIKYGNNSTVSDEIAKIHSLDIELANKLNETSGKVDTLREEFDAEVQRSKDEDENLNDKIDAEISRSSEKDAKHDEEIGDIKIIIGNGFTKDTHETVTYKFEQLKSIVDEEVTRATEADNELSAKITENSNSVKAEKERAESAEAELTSKIDATYAVLQGEITRSTVKDTEHDSAIQTNTNNIASEITRAKEVENKLSTDLQLEIQRAKNAEETIDIKVNTEITNRVNDDNILRSSIESEKSARESADNDLQSKISSEADRAKEAENILSSKLDELDEKVDGGVLTANNTTTIATNINGGVISSDLLIANGSNNIIKASSDSVNGIGIYATVDLEYNASSNKLKLITSSVEKEIALSIGSIIDEIVYDNNGRNLIIKYTTNISGVQTQNEVFVAVEDLFNDWDVEKGNHLGAIILNKSDENILSAEVVISELEDNMLINDNGVLYVSRKPIDDLSNDVNSLSGDVQSLLDSGETKTLHLYRDFSKKLIGDVKISDNKFNLITTDDNGILFNGNIDCGEY